MFVFNKTNNTKQVSGKLLWILSFFGISQWNEKLLTNVFWIWVEKTSSNWNWSPLKTLEPQHPTP